MFCLIPSVRVREGSVFKAVWHLAGQALPGAASDNSQSRCSAWGRLLTGDGRGAFFSQLHLPGVSLQELQGGLVKLVYLLIDGCVGTSLENH